METMEAYAGKLESRLKRWGTKVDDLATKAEEAGAEAKSEYHKHIADLKSKLHKAQAHLVALQGAGHERWETFKTDTETAFEGFEAALKNVSAQLLHTGESHSCSGHPRSGDAPGSEHEKSEPKMATDHAHD